MSALAIALAFVAGLLTVLSPCVLPILPVVFGAAASQHRFGPTALALGVASAFTAAGLLLATLGAAAGFDAETFKPVFGVLLVLFGSVLLVPTLQHGAERLLAPLAAIGARRADPVAARGLVGQFGLGALMGLVWSPCVGPTLGAASVLASQGQQLGTVALVMVMFGIGAAVPLLAVGVASRAILTRLRGSLIDGGRWGRQLMGAGMAAVGLIVLAGLDHRLEAILLDLTPSVITKLTTRV